jgi:hypothetical protein
VRTFKPGHVPIDVTREEMIKFARERVVELAKSYRIDRDRSDFAIGYLDGLNDSLKGLGFAPAKLEEILTVTEVTR